LLGLALVAQPPARAEILREFSVHVAQANAKSPYTFLRAKFSPGELSDPWTVRFFDAAGKEVPYFVWDAVDWRTAREGRADWGGQYPLLQHYPGRDPSVRNARADKITWASQFLPAVGKALAEEESRAREFSDSQCVVLYLLRYQAAPYAKDRLHLKVYDRRQVHVEQQQFKDRTQDLVVGDLRLQDFPLNPTVWWKGKPLLRYAGFRAGGAAGSAAHADGQHGYSWSVERGIITKLHLLTQTAGRREGAMSWDCTYWLFPEGACVGLEGFSLSRPEDYLGGEQVLSLLEPTGAAKVEPVAVPRWSKPWWVHRMGGEAFVASHLFRNAPLTVGYDNNPFICGDPRRQEARAEGGCLALAWSYELFEPGVMRYFVPAVQEVNLPPTAWTTVTEHLRADPEAARRGTIPPAPAGANPRAFATLAGLLSRLAWQPKTDWFYRQYTLGFGTDPNAAETAVSQVVCAAGGWRDRPWREEELAEEAVASIRHLAHQPPTARSVIEPKGLGLRWSLAFAFAAQRRDLLSMLAAQSQSFRRAGDAMIGIERLIRQGKDPISASGDPHTAWITNPAYTAHDLAADLRWLEWLGLPYHRDAYRQAISQYADFTLRLFGGEQFDEAQFRQRIRREWPSRSTMLIPLMLAAHRLSGEARYARAAQLVFEEIFRMVESNPRGYWYAWDFGPRGDEPYDTVYNYAGLWRGLGAFWQERRLDLLGDRGAKLATAEARWSVVNRSYSDNFEMDSFTSYATAHGGHPGTRLGMFLLLHDDFDFYRGLVGSMLRWQVLAPERHDGLGFRVPELGGARKSDGFQIWKEWAFGIYGGEHWDGTSTHRGRSTR
jgi:hypothetical protein